MSKKTRREARVPLKSGVLRRLDDPSLHASDRVLLDIFFGRLPAQKPYHYYRAAAENLLDPTLAGGYVQLERLELQAGRRPDLMGALKRHEKAVQKDDFEAARKERDKLLRLAESGLLIAEAARITRAAYEFVLDELDRDGYELDVEPADRAKIRELNRDEERREKARAVFVREQKRQANVTQAIRATAAETGYSERQLWTMTEDLRA